MALVLEAEITPGMRATDVVALARLAEAAGFDRLGISDVVCWPDCFMLAALCAQATERIRLGPLVTNPYTRHPAVLAAALATLHDVSGGRAFLGLGVGAGLEPIGVNYPRPVRTLREAIGVIRGLLSGEEVRYRGEVFTVEGARLEHLHAAPVPVAIGTRSPAVARLAGEIADAVLIGARYLSPAQAQTYRQWVAAGALRAGRLPEEVEVAPRLTLCVSHDGPLARASVKRYVAHYLCLLRPPDLDVEARVLSRLEAALAEARGWYFDLDRYDPPEIDGLITDDLVRRFAIAGTPAECAAQVRDVLALGFTSISLNLAAPRRESMSVGLRETITGFAEVVPELRRATA